MASSVVEYDRMAVPDSQTLMRPLLEEYADGGERPIAEVRAVLGTKFALTPEEFAERLPSGLAKTFDNRVGWAATYLYRVGLLARPRRSVYAITDRGRDVLVGQSRTCGPHRAFAVPRVRGVQEEQRAAASEGCNNTGWPRQETATPEERIDAAYQELREALIAEVRDMIASDATIGFQDLVLDVLHAMDYGDGTEHSRLRTGASGDAGIDGVIREDRLGLDVVYVQAKRWGGDSRPSGRAGVRRSSPRCESVEGDHLHRFTLLRRRQDLRGRACLPV